MKHTITEASKRLLAVMVLLAGDLTVLLGSFLFAFYLRTWVLVDILPLFPPMQHGLAVYLNIWGFLILWPLLFAYEGLYPSIGTGFWEETKSILRSNCMVFLILIILTFITKTSVHYSRLLLLITFFISLVSLPLGRRLLRSFLHRIHLWSKDVILIGDSHSLRQVTCYLKKHPDVGLKPVGIITPRDDVHDLGLHRFGDLEDLGGFVLQASEVIVSMPGISPAQLVEIIDRAGAIAPVVNIVPDLYGLASAGVEAHDLDGMLLLEMEDRLARCRNRVVKRLFDLSMSILTIILFAPLFGLIVLLIKMDSPGPSFFGHTRIGRRGRAFTCYKFRTMVADAQNVLDELLDADPQARMEWERDFKLKDDPRITRIGNFLRRTSLDELPQLYNVLKGDMSLVGPRPIISEEVQKYGDKVRYFFKVTPGITGLWQVSGRNNIDYDERVLLDEYYAKNWSLWLDIEIIIRTFGAVLREEGAY